MREKRSNEQRSNDEEKIPYKLEIVRTWGAACCAPTLVGQRLHLADRSQWGWGKTKCRRDSGTCASLVVGGGGCGASGGGWRVVAGIVAGGGVGFGVVAAAGADLVALVVGRVDADAMIFAVERRVGGDVRDRILIAKLVADV